MSNNITIKTEQYTVRAVVHTAGIALFGLVLFKYQYFD